MKGRFLKVCIFTFLAEVYLPVVVSRIQGDGRRGGIRRIKFFISLTNASSGNTISNLMMGEESTPSYHHNITEK